MVKAGWYRDTQANSFKYAQSFLTAFVHCGTLCCGASGNQYASAIWSSTCSSWLAVGYDSLGVMNPWGSWLRGVMTLGGWWLSGGHDSLGSRPHRSAVKKKLYIDRYVSLQHFMIIIILSISLANVRMSLLCGSWPCMWVVTLYVSHDLICRSWPYMWVVTLCVGFYQIIIIKVLMKIKKQIYSDKNFSLAVISCENIFSHRWKVFRCHLLCVWYAIKLWMLSGLFFAIKIRHQSALSDPVV